MFTHPYLAAELAREHHRDLVAQTRKHELRRQLRAASPAPARRVHPAIRRITAALLPGNRPTLPA